LITGCSPQPSAPAAPPARSASAGSPVPLGAPPELQGMSPHTMGGDGMSPHAMTGMGGASPHAMPSEGPEPAPNAKDPAVDKLVTAAKAAGMKSKAAPGNSALRAAAGEAYYKAGHEMMVSAKLNRKVKYRGALRLFREALRVDPAQRQAAGEKQLLEDIYRSMGRPIPR
jgi:hypothetical protein